MLAYRQVVTLYPIRIDRVADRRRLQSRFHLLGDPIDNTSGHLERPWARSLMATAWLATAWPRIKSCPVGQLRAEQSAAPDCLQRPLRSRFRQQVSASVRRPKAWGKEAILIGHRVWKVAKENDRRVKRKSTSMLGASAAAPPHMRKEQASPCVFCYRSWQPVGRRDRPRIGAVCPYVRLVSGVGDHITGDRRCPDPVWETACCSVTPAPTALWRPLTSVRRPR